MMKKLVILRIIATILIFGVLLAKVVKLDDVFSAMMSFHWSALLIALLLTLITLLLRAFRWVVITKDYKRLDLWSALFFYTVGIFYASVTPGRIGEVLRGVMYSVKKKVSKLQGILTVLIDRAWDLALLVLLALSYLVSDNIVFMLTMSFLVAPVLYNVGFLMIELLRNKIKALSKFRIKKQSLLSVYHVSAIVLIQYMIYGYIFKIILDSLGVTGVSMSYIMMSIAVSMLSLFIPITVNGWGVREGVWIMLLAPFTDAATAFTASVILVLTTTYSLAFIGGLLELAGIRASIKNKA